MIALNLFYDSHTDTLDILYYQTLATFYAGNTIRVSLTIGKVYKVGKHQAYL